MTNQENLDLAPAEFLNAQDSSLRKSLGVLSTYDYLRGQGVLMSSRPAERIEAYITFLRDVVHDGIFTGNQESIDRQIEVSLTKEEDVPESYFDFQRRILRQEGYGEVGLNNEVRHQLIEVARNDQRVRLRQWAEYISSDEAGYPDWFKYYTWESVRNLKPLDIEKETFSRRRRGTIATYPELNPEALAYVYNVLQKNRVENKPAETPGLSGLVKSGNFAKLYAYALREVQPSSRELSSTTKGAWTTYQQSNDSAEAERLALSLAGYGTGWCTAGEAVAGHQLKQGDFHVFYSEDANGENSVPRVAVRMENGKVREVRGILPGQELEPRLIEETLRYIKDLPGGDAYLQKASDMKRVTAIDDQLRQDPKSELSAEDIKFIYEFDRAIEGFGYAKDPRIGHIVRGRNLQADMDRIGLPIDEKLAERLLNVNQPILLLRNLDQFTGLTPSIIDQMKKQGCPSVIMDRIDLSKKIDMQEIMTDIMQSESTHFGLDNYVKYFNVDPTEAAMKIIELGDRTEFIDILFEFDRLPNLNKMVLLERIADGGKIGYVLEARKEVVENMRSADRVALADYLEKTGKDNDLAGHLELFPEVNRLEFAQRLRKAGKPSVVFWNITNFTEIDTTNLYPELLEEGRVSLIQITIYMDRIPDLDQNDLAQRLMDQADYSTLLFSIRKFTDVDPRYILAHMISHGREEEALSLSRSDHFAYRDFPEVSTEDLASYLIGIGQAQFVKNHMYELKLTEKSYSDLVIASLPRHKQLLHRVKRFVLLMP